MINGSSTIVTGMVFGHVLGEIIDKVKMNGSMTLSWLALFEIWIQ